MDPGGSVHCEFHLSLPIEERPRRAQHRVFLLPFLAIDGKMIVVLVLVGVFGGQMMLGSMKYEPFVLNSSVSSYHYWNHLFFVSGMSKA